jgi:hypothetical protein
MTDATQLLEPPASRRNGHRAQMPTTPPRARTDVQREATELKATATAEYLASVATGDPLSGTQLGEMHDRSPRWGRLVIEAAAANLGDGNEPAVERQPPPVEQPEAAAARQPDPDPEEPAATTRQPARRWQDTLTTLVVALVAAAASYGHMHNVALMAGESDWIAKAWPITVDGLAFAALRRGRSGRTWLGLSLAISIAANVIAQFPELAEMAGPVVAAWPPVALYGTHRLLHNSD